MNPFAAHVKIIVFVQLALVQLALSSVLPRSNDDYPYHAILDDAGDFQISWKYDADTITIQYTAASQGWAGLGFSPAGDMNNGDEAVFWVDNTGKGFVSDRHSAQAGFPPEDQHQDYFLTNIVKNNTHLISSFYRKRNTLDPEDWVLTTDDTHVIFSKSDEVPVDKDHFQKHTVANTKSLRFFGN